MSFKTRIQKQTAVYWAPKDIESGGKAFDKFGRPLYATPVEKECRWDDTAQVFVGEGGREETSRSVVMIDDVEIGGLLMLGSLTDVTDFDDPRNNVGAWEIRQKEKIPNIKTSLFYEWAYL